MKKLFVYGTLADPSVMTGILGGKVKYVSDKLAGYGKSRIEIEGETYPVAVSRKGDFVSGFVVEVTADKLKNLDDYETSAYVRRKVVLESGVIAWIYTANKTVEFYNERGGGKK